MLYLPLYIFGICCHIFTIVCHILNGFFTSFVRCEYICATILSYVLVVLIWSRVLQMQLRQIDEGAQGKPLQPHGVSR